MRLAWEKKTLELQSLSAIQSCNTQLDLTFNNGNSTTKLGKIFFLRRRKLAKDFVSLIGFWARICNSFGELNLWEDFGIVLLLYVPLLRRFACPWIVFGATTRHPSPSLATSLSIFQNSRVAVTKKNSSCAAAVLLPWSPSSIESPLSFTSCGYKYPNAIKHPQKSLWKAWIHLLSLELEIAAFQIQSPKR